MNIFNMTGKSDKELFVCSYPEWQEKRESTTFWDDFCIADVYGTAAVKDTFNRAFAGWKNNYKYLTELVMVLNHKLWYWYETDNTQLRDLYQSLYDEAASWCDNNLKSDEAKFYFYVTD